MILDNNLTLSCGGHWGLLDLKGLALSLHDICCFVRHDGCVVQNQWQFRNGYLCEGLVSTLNSVVVGPACICFEDLLTPCGRMRRGVIA